MALSVGEIASIAALPYAVNTAIQGLATTEQVQNYISQIKSNGGGGETFEPYSSKVGVALQELFDASRGNLPLFKEQAEIALLKSKAEFGEVPDVAALIAQTAARALVT